MSIYKSHFSPQKDSQASYGTSKCSLSNSSSSSLTATPQFGSIESRQDRSRAGYGIIGNQHQMSDRMFTVSCVEAQTKQDWNNYGVGSSGHTGHNHMLTTECISLQVLHGCDGCTFCWMKIRIKSKDRQEVRMQSARFQARHRLLGGITKFHHLGHFWCLDGGLNRDFTYKHHQRLINIECISPI